MLVNILDFNDSFTYNIAAEVYKLGLDVKVIPLEDIQAFLEAEAVKNKSREAFIYGPGPGHPAEYSHYFPFIEKLLGRKNIFHFGICLGHQILSLINGLEISNSCNPSHGQKTEIRIPNWEVFDSHFREKLINVQRYNSLAVVDGHGLLREMDQFWYEKELFISSSYNILTYQFHPESVGTSFRKELFTPLLNFLYNGRDEYTN